MECIVVAEVAVSAGLRVAGSAALVLVEGVMPLGREPALFEAMLDGWRRQQAARRLSAGVVEGRERLVRRFREFTGVWPWQWSPAQVDSWVASGEWAHWTVRWYQGALASFLDYVCDPRYGWLVECQQRVGAVPVQVCLAENTAAHVADYEGRPGRRPLSRGELQMFFDVADERVQTVQSRGCKGWLAAFRDATLFKVIYGWGLRRREAVMLDVEDLPTNPAAPQLGQLGVCHVRYGKAMRGSPPKRRAVATVMAWAGEALEQYLSEVRPIYGVRGGGGAVVDRAGRADLGAAGR
jgi:integrase